MEHLVRIKDRNEYIRDIYDFAEGIRPYVGSEAVDFLKSQYGRMEEELDALEKEYEETDDARSDAMSELDDALMALSSAESDLEDAQKLLIRIATHIVTNEKATRKLTHRGLYKKFVSMQGKHQMILMRQMLFRFD